MTELCLICNNKPAPVSSSVNILKECSPQGKPLTEILGDIIEKTVPKDLHSNVLCKKCYKTCCEFETVKIRLQTIKTNMHTQLQNTLQKRNVDSETWGSSANSPTKSPDDNTEKKVKKKLVLPASKLQPLPPDFVINLGNLNSSVNSSFKIKSEFPASPANNTISATILSQNIKKAITKATTKPIQSPTKAEDDKTIDKVIDANITNAISSILNTKTTSSIINVNNSLPKDFLSSAVLTKNSKEKEQSEESNGAMDLDDDCTLLRVTNDTNLLIDEDGEKDASSESSKCQYFDVSLIPVSEDATRDEDGSDADGDDYEETIVMSGDNASILRVVSGQKLVYEDGEISLMADDDDNSNQEDENNDGHDSNDESQIELQVSGDEETANAIIAAAQEQGGAFIKVESGEMYRVKSVCSTKKEVNMDEEADGPPMSVIVKDGDMFKCLLCEKNSDDPLLPAFPTSESASQHARRAHGARVYLCAAPACTRAFRRRLDLRRHCEEHKNLAEKNKIHECKVCKKRYNSRTLLNEHMNIHSGNRPYLCSICNKSFASKYTYQAHLKIHLERPRPFKCTLCSKTFLTQPNLTQHEKTHSGVRDYVCNVCGKAFGTQHNLEVHGVVHSGNKPFVCGVCGKAFARRAEVRDHMRTHTGERPFACEQCGAQFAQRSNLHSHRRATHLDDKRYHCDQCPKKFKRRRLLQYHVKASHTGERPLQCATCRATFVYPEHYKKHLRIHSGERPYECEVCGKSFNSRDNRNTHRFVHSDKKPYECLVCGAGYMRKQLLYAHMNTSGHLAESIVVNQPRVQKVVETVLPNNAEEDADDIKIDKLDEEPLFATEEELEVEPSETKAIGKSTINLVQDNDDPTLLTLHNIDGSMKAESGALLQGVNLEQIGDQAQVVSCDSTNGLVRLVQIQLQNGTSGWMAITQ